MAELKTKSLQNIERQMEMLDQDSLRYHILENAKNFKTSWMELGRALLSVYKDKLYREWGFESFDNYVAKEIGIRKETALKLLRSYHFLEKEEPVYLKKDYVESADAAKIPSYESIDVLRQAKSKKMLDASDYSNLKNAIFEKGKDAKEVKKDLTALIRQRQELDPEEAHEKRKLATIKRFLSTLKSLEQEIEMSKLLPAQIIKEAKNLIEKLEAQIK